MKTNRFVRYALPFLAAAAIAAPTAAKNRDRLDDVIGGIRAYTAVIDNYKTQKAELQEALDSLGAKVAKYRKGDNSILRKYPDGVYWIRVTCKALGLNVPDSDIPENVDFNDSLHMKILTYNANDRKNTEEIQKMCSRLYGTINPYGPKFDGFFGDMTYQCVRNIIGKRKLSDLDCGINTAEHEKKQLEYK